MFDSHWPGQSGASGAFGRRSQDRVPAFIVRRGAFFVLLGVLLAQLLLLSVQITRGRNVRLIQVWAVVVFSPFERAMHATVDSTVHAWSSVRDLWRVRAENQELRSQLAADHTRLQQLSEEAAEAGQLRALLGFKSHLDYRSIAAEVIAASPDQSSADIFINRGSDSNLAPDMPVITPEGVAGKIVAVYPHAAQVQLITDPSSGVGCMLQTTRTQCVLRGESRNVCALRYVMDDEKVNVGDAVVTSGLDQIYPKGLIVGTVVRAEVGNIYQRIGVKPAAELDRLENVLVLLNSVPEKQPPAKMTRP